MSASPHLASPLHSGKEVTFPSRCINFQDMRWDRATGWPVIRPGWEGGGGDISGSCRNSTFCLWWEGWARWGRWGGRLSMRGGGWWEPGESAWESFLLPPGSRRGWGQGMLFSEENRMWQDGRCWDSQGQLALSGCRQGSWDLQPLPSQAAYPRER